jgi:hypothetical protein
LFLKEDDSNVYKYYIGGKVPIYLNAERDDIRSLTRNSLGVRIGVVSPDEIYYWDADIYHSKMSSYLDKLFKLELTYDGGDNNIADYSSEDEDTDSVDKYPADKRELFKKIKYKIEELFPQTDIAVYLEKSRADMPPVKRRSILDLKKK